MPETLTATFRIVTPMFIGDADQLATEITAASVKGALRFWWRALNWGRFRNRKEATDESALRALHMAEAALFGAAADEKYSKPGQGRFLLRVVPPKKWDYMQGHWPSSKTGSGYLGQGLWESRALSSGNDQPHRTALNEGQNFAISMTLKPMPEGLLADTQATLRDVLTLWGLLGGLGSRTRRGFGSVQLVQLGDAPFVIKDMDNWFAEWNNLLSHYPLAQTYPPYSAFSRKIRLGYLPAARSARQSHETLGNHFKHFRGPPSELRGDIKRIFGMPLPGGSHAMEKARRGSPLLFHIVQLGVQQFVPVALSLPAEPFHPDAALNRVDWSLVDDFFDGLHSWKGEAA